MDVFAYLIPYGLEWCNLILRWLHVITAIAWMGASFYFIWLDNSIRPPAPGSGAAQRGVAGELWAVHGGGFYNPQKYLVAPPELPQQLHWFKWEAYFTWMSGFALLWVVYYFNAAAMMVDKSVADIAGWQAVAIGLATLTLGWIVYDLLCRSKLGRHDLWFGALVFALIVAAGFGLSSWLSGRAAYIHVGALIGTIMVCNVLMVIIPGQRKMVAALKAGQRPDPAPGLRAKQRSMHNNYFALPVVFIMISNHYAMTYRHAHSWLVLAFIMAAGVFIRHFFNLRHKGKTVWAYPMVGVALLLAVAVLIAPPAPTPRAAASDPAAQFSQVRAIIGQRCATCHSAHPTQPGFATAPAGVALDDAGLIRQHAARVYQQAVQLKAMPIGNLTQMTDAERATIQAWYEAGTR
ncbi:MAG: urate hydroxylase PuuD [Burkholderiaceae bacterium]|nr:urate hydroxylase PuuD [Burkholderiaceae bacterium]